MALLNIVSLSKHIDEIRVLLENQTVDILALNETRLHPDIPSEFVNIDGYDIVRMDRDKHGGGVCFYIRRTISYLNRGDLVLENLESVCLEINQPNSCSFIISTIYRPPSATVESFSQIESLLKNIDNEN
jgi:exonuclease III